MDWKISVNKFIRVELAGRHGPLHNGGGLEPAFQTSALFAPKMYIRSIQICNLAAFA